MPREKSSFDDAFRALVRARSLHSRLDALAAVIVQLHGIRQRTPSRKLPALGDLPLALRWFHANYERYPRVRGRFNAVVRARHITPGAEGLIDFLWESQGSFSLGFRPGAADPPVIAVDGPERTRQPVTVSGTLVLHVLCEFAMCDRGSLSANRAERRVLEHITPGLIPVPGTWRPPAWPVRVWAGRGVVVMALPFPAQRGRPNDEWTICVAAPRRADLRGLRPVLAAGDLDNGGDARRSSA